MSSTGVCTGARPEAEQRSCLNGFLIGEGRERGCSVAAQVNLEEAFPFLPSQDESALSPLNRDSLSASQQLAVLLTAARLTLRSNLSVGYELN